MKPYRRNINDVKAMEKDEAIKARIAAIVDRYADPNSEWDFENNADILALMDGRLRYPVGYFINYRLTQFAGRGTPQQRAALVYAAALIRSGTCSDGIAMIFAAEPHPRVKDMALDAMAAVKGKACRDVVKAELTSGNSPAEFTLRLARLGLKMGFVEETKSFLEPRLNIARNPVERVEMLTILYRAGDAGRMDEIRRTLERERPNPRGFAETLNALTSAVSDEKVYALLRDLGSYPDKPSAAIALLKLIDMTGLPEDFPLGRQADAPEDAQEPPPEDLPLIEPSMPDEMFRARQNLLLVAAEKQWANRETGKPYEE